jgi:hypothetical protein
VWHRGRAAAAAAGRAFVLLPSRPAGPCSEGAGAAALCAVQAAAAQTLRRSRARAAAPPSGKQYRPPLSRAALGLGFSGVGVSSRIDSGGEPRVWGHSISCWFLRTLWPFRASSNPAALDGSRPSVFMPLEVVLLPGACRATRCLCLAAGPWRAAGGRAPAQPHGPMSALLGIQRRGPIGRAERGSPCCACLVTLGRLGRPVVVGLLVVGCCSL